MVIDFLKIGIVQIKISTVQTKNWYCSSELHEKIRFNHVNFLQSIEFLNTATNHKGDSSSSVAAVLRREHDTQERG
jgi:hypothetical protein